MIAWLRELWAPLIAWLREIWALWCQFRGNCEVEVPEDETLRWLREQEHLSRERVNFMEREFMHQQEGRRGRA